MENKSLVTTVIEVKNHSTLKMKFDCGLNDNGKVIMKTRSFSNVKHNASSVDVYNVAETLASLQQHTLQDVLKQDNTSIAE